MHFVGDGQSLAAGSQKWTPPHTGWHFTSVYRVAEPVPVSVPQQISPPQSAVVAHEIGTPMHDALSEHANERFGTSPVMQHTSCGPAGHPGCPLPQGSSEEGGPPVSGAGGSMVVSGWPGDVSAGPPLSP